ncbi:MAG: M50 family metallopeptidase [Chloroflexota bacterium]
MKKTDLFWLLAYPIYQTIGTIRHEGAHAIAAIMQGARITEFVYIPSMHNEVFYWGYVRWIGETDWLTLAAPYFLDLLTFALAFLICFKLPFKRHWLWLNLVILGMVSPLANSSYIYQRSFTSTSANDVVRLLADLPDFPIHAYFIATLTLYTLGLIVVFRRAHHLTA